MQRRRIYGFIHLIGDLGGVSDIFIKVVGIFTLPISYFSFIFEAIENLYIVKSKNGDKHFKNTPKRLKNLKIMRNKKNKELKLKKSHFTISFSILDKVKILILNMFESIYLLKCKFSEKSQEQLKLFREGEKLL